MSGPHTSATSRPPGFWLPWWLVADYPDLTWSARLVYARIAFLPRGEDDTVWVHGGQGALARELGMSRRTVTAALDSLTESGLLVKERTGEERMANAPLRYVVHAPLCTSQSADFAHPEAQILRPVIGGDQGELHQGHPTPPTPPDVERVFAHWAAVAGREGVIRDVARTKLTEGRRKAIRSRLRERYSVDDLCEAIDSAFKSEFHRSTPAWLELASVLGSAAKVDRHLATSHGRGLAEQDRRERAEHTLAKTAAMREWMDSA